MRLQHVMEQDQKRSFSFSEFSLLSCERLLRFTATNNLSFFLPTINYDTAAMNGGCRWIRSDISDCVMRPFVTIDDNEKMT